VEAFSLGSMLSTLIYVKSDNREHRSYNGTKGRMILLGVSGPMCILCSPLFLSCSGRSGEYEVYSAIAGNEPDT
jgi:hypothetical protein